MSSRLAFQTQLASIMEVLANAAVAEICKLVDDEYAVVSLQMSQCQRENKALKRKLHLLELKMARGNAERRLRESAMNSSRPRLLFSPGDRLRESAPATGGVFERQMAVALWSGRAAAGEAANQTVRSDNIQSKSPDVELVEPEDLDLKEEKVEENMRQIEETEEAVPLIGDDGVLECVPRGAAGQRHSLEQQDISQTQTQISRTRRTSSSSSSSNNRGAEEAKPEVVMVKVEDVELVNHAGLSIQEGLVESSTDDYRGVLPFEETPQASNNQLPDLQESGGGFSESAAPQLTPMMSEDSSKAAAVQLRVPDTNTPASPNTQQQQQQQQRSINGSNFPSDYSLFELETFFTRWAPDNDSASPTAGPSCPFPADNPAESDQDGVIIVESKPSVSSAVSLSAGGSSVHIQPSVPQGTSASTHLRTPTRSSQRPWSRTTAAIRLGQVPSAQSTMSSNVAAVTLTKSQDKRSVSRTMSSTAAPQAALSVRGSATVLAGIEAAIAAQHRASFLARRNKYPIASTVPVDRRRKSYVCRACGKAFSGLSNLEAHERVHTGEKPFRCNTCGKHFSEAGNLKKHQRVHTGEKPFSCDQCGKRFAWICNLRTHQQSATGCGAQGRAGLGLGPSSHTVNCGGHDADAGCISHT